MNNRDLGELAKVCIMLFCGAFVAFVFLFLCPIWMNIVVWAIAGWIWAGRKKQSVEEDLPRDKEIKK